jgi:hypothetical protein
MKSIPALDVVLSYRHPEVVASYRRNHPASRSRADSLFTEMLRFLWLSQKHAREFRDNPGDESLNFSLVMHEEMREIDNMWHSFILYTKDYTDFCLEKFGEYLHHEPDIATKNPQSLWKFKADLEKFLSYAYDELGEETVRAWFAQHLHEASIVVD